MKASSVKLKICTQSWLNKKPYVLHFLTKCISLQKENLCKEEIEVQLQVVKKENKYLLMERYLLLQQLEALNTKLCNMKNTTLSQTKVKGYPTNGMLVGGARKC